MNKKQNIFEKLGNFIGGKGFYLVVLVCVAAIALSGWYLVRSVNNGLADQPDQPVSGSAPIVETGRPSPTVSLRPTVSPTPAPTPEISAVPSPKPAATPTPAPTAAPSPSPSPKPSASPAALVFTWPVKGTVISDYSVEVLAYDTTMGDWRTHAGLDISASVGTQVLATAAGTVSTIYVDDLLGTTVVIDHGSGLTSVYSSMAPVPTVKVGAAVSTGTVIGTVGNTAPAESGLGPHLHFALYKNDKAVDPQEYLPQR